MIAKKVVEVAESGISDPDELSTIVIKQLGRT
jgi:hypothetical protein